MSDIVYFTADRPDKYSDRSGWNASWERDLAANYGNLRRSILSVSLEPSKRRFLDALSLSDLPDIYHEREKREVIELQTDLSQFIVRAMATDDFETKWKALPQARREELVLEGLWHASCAGPNMEKRRRWCPEMRLDFLAADGGQGFLDMVTKVIPYALEDTSAEPVLFPHPQIDWLLRNERLCRQSKEIRLDRAYFISITLWRVLLAFYGKEENYVIGKVPAMLKKDIRTINDAAKSLDRESKKELRYREQLFQQQRKAQVHICWNCGKDSSQLETGEELKVCGNCKGTDHPVRYCSKKCQRKDWNAHKAICGKEILDRCPPPTRETSHASVDERIPSPAPGFKRTPALLHQISFLKKPPCMDYVFMFPPPQDVMGVMVGPYVTDRILFLIVRYRALKNGDALAVAIMFDLLIPHAMMFDFPIIDLKKQLNREFGVDVNTLSRDTMTLEPLTENEIRIASKELEIYSLHDRLQSAPSLSELGLQTIAPKFQVRRRRRHEYSSDPSSTDSPVLAAVTDTPMNHPSPEFLEILIAPYLALLLICLLVYLW